MPSTSPSFATLKSLLEERLKIIADHAWRERDAGAHLAALQRVSEEIEHEHERLRDTLPPKLRHFLAQASYQKALEALGSPE